MERERAQFELGIAQADLAAAKKARDEAAKKLRAAEEWVADAVERVNKADTALRTLSSGQRGENT
jgi:hypothetical protein